MCCGREGRRVATRARTRKRLTLALEVDHEVDLWLDVLLLLLGHDGRARMASVCGEWEEKWRAGGGRSQSAVKARQTRSRPHPFRRLRLTSCFRASIFQLVFMLLLSFLKLSVL